MKLFSLERLLLPELGLTGALGCTTLLVVVTASFRHRGRIFQILSSGEAAAIGSPQIEGEEVELLS